MAGHIMSPLPTGVLVVDDHALLREGIAEILRAQDDFRVVGEASDGAEAVARARELVPDIVLMDLSMPGMDGLAATRLLTGGQHDWKIVILTIAADKDGLIDAINAGASGYLLKTMHAADLLGALRRMRNGEPALAPTLADCVIEELRRLSSHPAQAISGPPPAALTRREEEVLALIVKGATDQQIARTLCVSLYTVKSHVRNILAKLNARGRHEAARYARREGLLK
jgi:DNA-binding NarL/FixJ family response regulator